MRPIPLALTLLFAASPFAQPSIVSNPESQEGVSLKRGERGYYVLFQEEAEYEHVYTLDLPETGWWMNSNVNVPAPNAQKFDVWHTLEFENPTSFPSSPVISLTTSL